MRASAAEIFACSEPDAVGKTRWTEWRSLAETGTRTSGVDALAVHKDLDGDIEVAHLSNIPDAEALLEHRWAIPFRDAVVRAGGFRIGDGFVSPLDMIGIGLVSAAEAKELHEQERAAAGQK